MKYQPQHRNGDNSAFYEGVKTFEETIDFTHILSNEVLMPDTKLSHKVLNMMVQYDHLELSKSKSF